MIFPSTRPASEFQLTWSPILKLLLMAFAQHCVGVLEAVQLFRIHYAPAAQVETVQF